MDTEKYQVIFNPASAGGKTKNRKPFILRLLNEYFRGSYDLHETASKGHANKITGELCREGFTNFIIAGGDGTIQESVNGLFLNGKIINNNCRMGIISSGTGQGFAKSLGLPRNMLQQIGVIKKGNTRRSDLGLVKFGNNGLTNELIFVNELQAGIGGSVVKNVNGKEKRLGGSLAYSIKTLAEVLSYQNEPMRISFEGRKIESEFLGVVVANGAYTGGSMNLAPKADPFDNSLDLLLMYAQGIPGRLNSFRKIYSGSHISSGHFGYFSVKNLSLSSAANVILEADGEILPQLPCRIEVIPSALKIFIS